MPAVRGMALGVFSLVAAPLFLPAAAQAAPRDGLFISVPHPIDDKAVDLIQRKLEHALKERPIAVVVFDFNPQKIDAATSEWTSANRLAEYIQQLRGLPRKLDCVAFVQAEVGRHTLLPVMACSYVYMSDALTSERQYRAKLGRAGTGDEAEPLVAAYRRVAQKHAAPDVVLRLLNSDPIYPVPYPDGSTHYLSAESLEALARKELAFAKIDLKDLTPAALVFPLDPDQARKYELCQALVHERADLLQAFKLTTRSLIEDDLFEQTLKPVLFRVTGKLDKSALNDLKGQVGSALRDRHNFLIFELDSSGGDTRDVASFASWLADLKLEGSPLPARTVAYLPPKASIGSATFIALGCQEIVMGPESALADFSYLLADKEQLPNVRDMILPLARKRGYPTVLFEAALTPGMALYHVRDRKDGEEQIVGAEQFDADKKAATPRWENLGRIEARDGELLKITTRTAQKWQVAGDTGETVKRVEDIYTRYGLDDKDVTKSKPGWLYRVAEFFREPVVNFALIMLGILGLILELKMPGTTVPGVLGAICFVLFFWSYSFVGEFTLLASLLFVLGLILIGIEIFVLPGFGFTGITGIFLIIFSLVLVTLDNIPQTSEDWVNVGARITTLSLGLVSAVVAAFVVAYYLPSIPYANRLVLKPPDDEALAAEETSFGPTYAHLLGAIGVAATTLRPAGKAQFGEEFFDVVAEGDYVSPGGRVQVIEIEGNRIVVKEI
jgi:membrane-bound serine protease (ClpP class)